VSHFSIANAWWSQLTRDNEHGSRGSDGGAGAVVGVSRSYVRNRTMWVCGRCCCESVSTAGYGGEKELLNERDDLAIWRD
jgi:hypothetical protein